MSDHDVSAYPSGAGLEARRDGGVWGPGLKLLQHQGPRANGLLLLLLLCLSLLLLALLALRWTEAMPPAGALSHGLRLESLHGVVDAAWPALHSLPLEVVGLALLAVAYLGVCAWMSMAQHSALARPSARPAAGSPESGTETPAAAAEAPTGSGEDRSAHRDEAAGPQRLKQAGPDVHGALQLSSQQVGTAVGEAARRTLTLCGAFDSCTKHVEVAGADLDALQDEAALTQQLMVALRARLLALGAQCQALGSAAQRMADPAAPGGAAQRIDELLEVLGAETVHCHQLSERIGIAERSGERRIDSIRRCIEGLGYQADRGLREGHQVMVLTRQIEASLAEGARQLQQLAGVCGAAEAADASPPLQAQEPPRGT